MRFANPWFFAIAPLLLLIFLRAKKTGTALTYSITDLVADFNAKKIVSLIRVLLAIILLVMVAALARPVTAGGRMPVMTRTRDTIILIDKSGSMNFPFSPPNKAGTQAMPPVGIKPQSPSQLSKYELARLLAAKFIESRPEDRLTACVFFDYTFYGAYEYRVVCPLPLTRYDHDLIIEWLRMPDVARGGTPLAEAMIAALKHLDEMGQTGERTLILLSDGDGDWSGDMEFTIAELLTKSKAKLFWVFIEDITLIEMALAQGNWTVSQQGLNRLIPKTGGKRFDASSPQDLERAFDEIKRLASQPVVVFLPMAERELYPFFVSGSLTLLFLTFAWMRFKIR
jgi:mxaC protein